MRTSRLLLSIAFALAAPTLLTAQKRPDVCLDPEASYIYPNEQQLVASGSMVHAAWIEEREQGLPHVYYTRSLDGGRTWFPGAVRIDTGLVEASLPSDVQLAASGASVYALWLASEIGVVGFNRSLDGGTTWLPSAMPLGSENSRHNPQIAAAGDHVYAVWFEFRGGGEHTIFFTRSLDRGSSWSAVRALDLGNPTDYVQPTRPQIVATDSAVFVTWSDRRNGRSDIFVSGSFDEGTTWPLDQRRLDLGSPPGTAHSVSPCIAAQGLQVFVSWLDTRSEGGDVYFTRSLDGGLTWLPEEVRVSLAAPPGTGADSPALAVSGSDVYVSWLEGTYFTSTSYYNRSRDNGATWERVARPLAPGIENATGTLVASESCVFTLWSRTGFVDDGFFFDRSVDRGETWLPAAVAISSGPPAAVGNGSVAVGGSSVYAMWLDSRGGSSPQMYFTLVLGHQPYGNGLAGSGGFVPELRCEGEPCIGRTFIAEVEHGRGGAPAVVAVGLNGPASIPFRGGTLLVQPPLFQKVLRLGGTPGVAGAGSGSVPLFLPLDASLLGTRLNLQAFVLDPGAPRKAALSAGIESWIL